VGEEEECLVGNVRGEACTVQGIGNKVCEGRDGLVGLGRGGCRTWGEGGGEEGGDDMFAEEGSMAVAVVLVGSHGVRWE